MHTPKEIIIAQLATFERNAEEAGARKEKARLIALLRAESSRLADVGAEAAAEAVFQIADDWSE